MGEAVAAKTGRVYHTPPLPGRGRFILNRARSVVTTVAGLIGVAVILWLVISTALNLTLVTFRTGSMAPVAPQGAAAVMEVVPVTQLEVGDVVTVSRAGRLPVTHRIVRIDPVLGVPEARSLTLKGDANATPDVEPVIVEDEIRRMVFAIPNAGTVLQTMQRPASLLTVGVALAALVAWAFWPDPEPITSRGPQHRLGHTARHASIEAARLEKRV